MNIETFHISEKENKALRDVIDLLRLIEAQGGNGKIFVEVCKKVIDVKGTIHLSGK